MKKSSKNLPKSSNDIHLKNFGYSLNKNQSSRHKSLSNASKKIGKLIVLKHVNLIRNLTKKGSINKKKLSSDVNYLKKKYSNIKK